MSHLRHREPPPPADPVHRAYPVAGDEEPEILLPRGEVTVGVVRIGDTVRRPHQPTSLAVAAYLDHLHRVGFDAAPRYLGRDGAGRDVLSYVPGDVAGTPPEPWAADDALLTEVGGLVRRLHEASAGYGARTGFAPPPGAVWLRDTVRVDVPAEDGEPELISHNDVTPQNVVFREGRAVALIDFDLVGPTTRLRELANTALHWIPLRAPQDLWPTWRGVDQAARLRVLADGYGLDDDGRHRLVDVAIAACGTTFVRMRAAAEQFGGGWRRMWDEGLGEVILRRERWLIDSREILTAALLTGR